MNFYLFLLIFIALIILLTAGIFLALTKVKNSGSKDKDRKQIIKNANRRLAQNPKDADAISNLADLYYNEEIYDKAVHLLKVSA